MSSSLEKSLYTLVACDGANDAVHAQKLHHDTYVASKDGNMYHIVYAISLGSDTAEYTRQAIPHIVSDNSLSSVAFHISSLIFFFMFCAV